MLAAEYARNSRQILEYPLFSPALPDRSATSVLPVHLQLEDTWLRQRRRIGREKKLGK
jgi:hypothetical protein